MNLLTLHVSAPVHKRVWGYLLERFPPVAYTVLVALFVWSGFALAGASDGHRDAGLAAVVVLLVFFHLRVMDEHKDAETDRHSYPDRLLTRGVVTLPLLTRLAAGAIAIEALAAWAISRHALWAWLACALFTAAMRVEFGLGHWLRSRLLAYAISHNPIVALLAVFIWVAADGPIDAVLCGYAGAVSLGSLAFELGRKIHLPESEVAGVDSYSSVYGRARSGWFVMTIRWFTSGTVALLAWTLASVPIAMASLATAVVATAIFANPNRSGKTVELTATGLLLIDFILLGALA